MKYLAEHGHRLLAAGYDVVPIAPGVKFPKLKNWQSTAVTPRVLDRWLANGHAGDGVGVRAARTPAIDIDVTAEDVTAALADWCQANVGMAPERVGNAPKRLLAYRAETPFPKMSSVWVDRDGKDQKVEILGDGQQWVSFHVHPDTGRPYQWLGRDSLLTIAHDDLEPLTPDLARLALAEFDRLAGLRGWKRKQASLEPLKPRETPSDDDALAYAQDAPDISDDALHAYLMAIPNEEDDDYDRWVQVGMALHHHYQGTDDGLEMWREWSERSPKYDAEALDRKWPTLRAAPGRAAKTARYIIMLGKAASKEVVKAQTATLRDRLARAATLDDLRDIVTDAAKTRDLDTLGREALESALKAAYRRIEGSPMGAKAAKALLRQTIDVDDAGAPNWLKPWCFLAGEDVFFSMLSGERVTKQGFNARYDRYMLSAGDKAEGRAVPSIPASDYALTIAQVPAPYAAIYLPGEDAEFSIAGKAMVNSYKTINIPEVPDVLSAKDRRNVKTVEQHFRVLIPDDRERAIVLSWLAYAARTLKRSNFAVLLQGTEGDGKSFVVTLMAAVCGSDNVKVINPATLSHGSFTDWAHGSLLACVEEIKLHGHNRHDVLNAIKPNITNPTIEIHPKGKAAFNAPNTQNYLLLTNFADALPISDQDSRYFIVNTQFQSRLAVLRWETENPGYFDRLFAAIDESPGALRGWLLTYPAHAEFKPKGRAPWSRGREYMARMSASDESAAVDIALAESGHAAVSDELLDQGVLLAEIERVTESVQPTWRVRRKLSELGFRELGRYDVKGEKRTLWSRTPQYWEVKDAPGRYDRDALFKRLTGTD